MAYSRPEDSLEAFPTPDGGFEFEMNLRGRTYTRLVPANGFVSQAEAAVMFDPPVSRVAVFQWVKARRLLADEVDGVSMIRVSRLRKFAAENGRRLVGEV